MSKMKSTEELEAELSEGVRLRNVVGAGILDWNIIELKAVIADRKETHFDEMMELLEKWMRQEERQIKERGKDYGAKEVLIYSKEPLFMEEYGFIRRKEIPMVLKL